MQIQRICWAISIALLMRDSKSSAHFRSYILHEPDIVLLGDNHAIWPRGPLELGHLAALMNKIYAQKKPSTFLVEDYYAAQQRKLQKIDTDYLEKSLLVGLIQRISAVNRSSLSGVCIERGNILARAVGFFRENKDCPPIFWDVSPCKISKEARGNAYDLRFLDLINEVTDLRQKLDERRAAYLNNAEVQSFMDFMLNKIDKQLEDLYQTMLEYNLKETESILEASVRSWILQKICSFRHSDQVNHVVQVGYELECFINNYKQRNMTEGEWQKSSDELWQKCLHVMDPPTELEQKQPSLCEKFLANIASLPMVKKWFKQTCTEEPKRQEKKQEIAWPCFNNPSQQIYACLMGLRMLIFDSHATLDILEHTDTHVVLIAGDDHVNNITKYLAQLGFRQVQKAVYDINYALNKLPMDLDKLHI